MDEHARPTSSTSNPPSPASFFSAAGNGGLVLEFPYTEVLEQWLMDDDDDNAQDQPPLEHGAVSGDGGGSSADLSSMNNNPPAAAATKRRGRKPGPSSGAGPAFSHVEAERHRRDKLHRRFCDLRAAVPNVTRMDKASLLADATAYISELRARVEQLEVEATRAALRKASPFLVVDDDGAAPAAGSFGLEEDEKLEVRMVVGQESAALRLTTAARHRHATARLMDALRSLDLPVQHACACRVGGVIVQDAVVDVPTALRDEGRLRAALLHRLQHSG
ncbi:hypothetical protein SEVIR_6G239700v4 [Setaria viridis]|uniref:Transcription factor n=1 Tax=Setaria viridis TaxID=4556 RepID=A0A4U6U7D7_SETVI|nr:transcription factor bHLH14-like [Setaria viridis]TKW11558.1 hypothetical protein SEVIR_6G239700v2 [Setaria viridis]